MTFTILLCRGEDLFDYLKFPEYPIDRVFLFKNLGGLAMALLLFVTQTIAGLTPGVTALSIAMILFVITTVGTANAVGLCHLNRIPIYLPANSLKFAHRMVSEQHIYKVESQRSCDNLTYRRATYSHDQVDLQLIDHVVTLKKPKCFPKQTSKPWLITYCANNKGISDKNFSENLRPRPDTRGLYLPQRSESIPHEIYSKTAGI